MRVLQTPLLAVAYFSVATVLAEAAALGIVWAKGNLNSETGFQLLAIAYDVDLNAVWKRVKSEATPIREAQVSYDEVVESRAGAGLNLYLREMAADKGLNDIRELQSALEHERDQYRKLKDDFDQALEQLKQGAADQGLQDVQRQLVSATVQQAKDQMVRILDEPTIESETSMQFVVTILKAMPLDKRKKILSEFKEQELDQLHEILKRIRRGVPNVDLIRETRHQLEQFESQQ